MPTPCTPFAARSRGYDVTAFAASGAHRAVGLDLSPDAVAAARAALAAQDLPPLTAAAVELEAGNFFSYSHPTGEAFDLGYDYTFLCALHPDMRRDWALTWRRLLAPGGELVTLIFPVGPSQRAGGVENPPWQVTPELYQDLLLPAGVHAACCMYDTHAHTWAAHARL
jgi:methyl halide transferase